MLKAQHAVAEWKHNGGKGPLNLSYMGLTALPPLPADLMDLRCVGNALTALPLLPQNLRILMAADNRLTELPPLPSMLTTLIVTGNRLARLPLPLPPALEQFHCSHNCLTDDVFPSMDAWPPRLHTFYCTHNRLRECLELPAHITRRHMTVCWKFRPYLLHHGEVCPCCG